MQRIQSSVIVKFAGPTDHRGARWIVKDQRWPDRVTVPYDYSVGIAQNVTAAAEAYLTKAGIEAKAGAILEIPGGYAVALA